MPSNNESVVYESARLRITLERGEVVSLRVQPLLTRAVLLKCTLLSVAGLGAGMLAWILCRQTWPVNAWPAPANERTLVFSAGVMLAGSIAAVTGMLYPLRARLWGGVITLEESSGVVRIDCRDSHGSRSIRVARPSILSVYTPSPVSYWRRDLLWLFWPLLNCVVRGGMVYHSGVVLRLHDRAVTLFRFAPEPDALAIIAACRRSILPGIADRPPS